MASDLQGALRRLSEWSAAVSFGDLPEDVKSKTKQILMDDVGAMIGASMEPETSTVRELLLRSGGRGEATVLAPGFPQTDRFTAANVNGLGAAWLELDEGYRLAACHAGIYTIPAALAEAEAFDHSGKDLLVSLVVGYEVVARFSRAWRFPPLILHPHGVFAVIGATAAVAKMRGLNADRFLQALTSAAATSIASPYSAAIRGALVRNVWAGNGARDGLLAAEIVDTGIAGLERLVDDVFGGIYRAELQVDALTNSLGTNFSIMGGYHKRYACCQYAHSALDALFSLDLGLVDAASDVDAITVYTHPAGLSLTDQRPTTTLGGKFSMPHIMATALYHRSAGRKAFGVDSLNHPVVAGLREKVVLAPYTPILEWPHDRPARVVLRLRSGEEMGATCEVAKGDPSIPLDRDDLSLKFRDLVEDAGVDAGGAEQRIGNLESMSVRELTRSLGR